MTKLKHLEDNVLALDGPEFAAFTQWFEDLQSKRFDDAIQRDAESGALDRLAEEAVSEFRAGRTRPL